MPESILFWLRTSSWKVWSSKLLLKASSAEPPMPLLPSWSSSTVAVLDTVDSSSFSALALLRSAVCAYAIPLSPATKAKTEAPAMRDFFMVFSS